MVRPSHGLIRVSAPESEPSCHAAPVRVCLSGDMAECSSGGTWMKALPRVVALSALMIACLFAVSPPSLAQVPPRTRPSYPDLFAAGGEPRLCLHRGDRLRGRGDRVRPAALAGGAVDGPQDHSAARGRAGLRRYRRAGGRDGGGGARLFRQHRADRAARDGRAWPQAAGAGRGRGGRRRGGPQRGLWQGGGRADPGRPA